MIMITHIFVCVNNWHHGATMLPGEKVQERKWSVTLYKY